VKTPAPQRAAGRRKLAAEGQALAGGTAPIPDLAYLKKAIRAKGRVDPAKWPALKALIVRRAKQLKATDAPGVKGTWAFQGAGDGEAIEMATRTARRMPVIRGAADVQASRSAPGVVMVQHKSTGMKVGTLSPAGSGWQATHANGTRTPASGSMAGAMAGLIAYHNKIAAARPAAGFPAAQNGGAATPAGGGIANLRGYAAEHQDTLDLAAALPHSTPAVSAPDGPRVTSQGGAGKAAGKTAPKAQAMSAEVALVYAKLIRKGLSPKQAMALAKRAAVMHAKAAAEPATAKAA
jgi:hypothetical protein